MTPPSVEYRIIFLTRGHVAYVSPHRYEEINSFKWCARWDKHGQCYYAMRGDKYEHSISMHRQILGLPYGDPREGDHRDRKRTLDNTDENLRIATRSQQMHNQGIRKNNTSGFKRVSFHKPTGKWSATICVNRQQKHLGLYSSPEEAYAVYCEAAKKYHGEFACVS